MRSNNLWDFLLVNHQYIFEDVYQGPGPAAGLHRKDVFQMFFPHVRGTRERRNRTRYWIIFKLANGDIETPGIFQHFCTKGCCSSKRDFLRKLKWYVSIPALPSITIGLRMCCTPVFNLMAGSLQVGGTVGDRLQFAKGA